MKEPITFFHEAEKLVREKGFGREVDWCETRPSFEVVDKKRFLTEYAWVVLNCGMKNKVVESKWAGIRKAFLDFDAQKIVKNGKDVLVNALSIFGNVKKINAIFHVAMQLHFGNFSAVKQNIKRDPLGFLETLPFIGNVTKYHLARNLGFDYVKPDRHLVRLATKFGMTPFELCQTIHEKTGRRLGTIDVILWRFCEQKGQVLLPRFFGLPDSESHRFDCPVFKRMVRGKGSCYEEDCEPRGCSMEKWLDCLWWHDILEEE